jgi:uncharacterized YccA/Bax inhibitor family protein
MANPVLTPQRFEREGASGAGWASTAGPSAAGGATTQTTGGAFGGRGLGGGVEAPAPSGKVMTLGGTLTAIGVLFTIILVAGAFGWMQVDQTTGTALDPETGQEVVVNTTQMPGWMIIAVLVGFGLAILTAFKPKLSPFTSPVYALFYGAALGAISAVYNSEWNGIVVQAIGATLAVFFVMFFLYATRIIKVTKKYVAVVLAATLGIVVMYAATWIATLFGADIGFWREPSALGIGISVVIVIVAALNLGIDFAFIERASAAGDAPKYMEWYGAFGVTVTVVWLYLEILRLLSLLRSN